MSTDYRLEKEIRMEELFDGRLSPYGVRELREESSSSEFGVLTDGKNQLVVYAKDVVKLIKRCGLNNETLILNAIAEVFDTKIYSEHSPQFWGFETQADWDAYQATAAEQSKRETYTEIMKFTRGEPSDIHPGTLGQTWANIATEQISKDPGLASQDRMDELMDMVYEKSIVKWVPPNSV